MVMVVVLVVVRVRGAVVGVLVRVLRAGREPRVCVPVMLVVVSVLVGVLHRVVGMGVLVLTHAGPPLAHLYQPWTDPTSTIGPVELFGPPFGAMDTANAVTSVGWSLRDLRDVHRLAANH
jgi:hypothetical protein